MARPTKNNADYFTHDSDMRNDAKVKALRARYGFEGYAVWCMLLETLTASDNFALPWDDITIELTACDYGLSEERFREIITYMLRIFLVENSNGYLFSTRLIERFQPLIQARESDRSRKGQSKESFPAGKQHEKKVFRPENAQSKSKSNSNNSPPNAHARTHEGQPNAAAVEAEKAPSPPVPPAPPPPSDLPGVCAAAESWCESNPDQVRFWVESARYKGNPIEQIPRFFSYYWGEKSREHRARSEPLDFFQNKFLSWLTNEKNFNTSTTNPPKNGKASQRTSTGRANGYEEAVNRTAIAELLLERHGISLDQGG